MPHLLLLLLLATLLSAPALSAQEHPRLFRDASIHATGAEWIAAQRAKAAADPFPAMLAANERAAYFDRYPARPSTLAALYLFDWAGIGNNRTAEDWAALARMKTLALIADPGRWANPDMRSLSRGIDTLHVGVAYDILSTSADWQNHTVAAVEQGITRLTDTPYALLMPPQYVGLPLNEAVSLALRLNADSLVASGGPGWPGNDRVGNNWFAVRYGGALFGYLASDEIFDTSAWNTALQRLSTHLDATLTRSPAAQGWNPEGHGYIWFPGWHTLPLVLALRNTGGPDLTQTWPALNLTLWAAGYATGVVPVARVPDLNQALALGIRPDFSDDHNAWGPEGTAGLAFALAPPELLGGMKWIYRRLAGDLGDDGWDAEAGNGLYSLLFWPEMPEENPTRAWGNIYYDPAFGLATFRRSYGDGSPEQVGDSDDTHAMVRDISVSMTANLRPPLGGHSGPDALSPRILGLGQIWATGQGRNNDVSASTTLFSDDPTTLTSAATRFGTRVTDTYFRRRTGDGYIIMEADVGDGGVVDHTRRLLVDYSGQGGAPAVFLISDSTKTRHPWWRLNTFIGHTVDISTPGRFLLSAPTGERLLGVASINGPAPALRTGTRPRGNELVFNGAAYSQNRWVDFQAGADGEVLVAIVLVPAGDPLPDVEITRHADGSAMASLSRDGYPGIEYSFHGNHIEVDGWNPPDLIVTQPLAGATLAQSLGEHLHVPVSGTVTATGSGDIVSVEVLLNDALVATLPIHAPSASWGPVILPTLPVGEHRVSVRALDELNEEKQVDVDFRVTATQPPIVAFTSPSAANRIWAGQDLVLRGRAADPEGRLNRVEIWEYRHADFYAGAGPRWRTIGNATLGTGATWHFTLPDIPAGRFAFFARAVDSDGDTTDSPVLEILSSVLFGDDPVYGDAGNFMKNLRFNDTGLWALEFIDGAVALRARDGDHRMKQAFLLGTGASASFRLRLQARALDMPGTQDRYEVAFGAGHLLDMTRTNSIQPEATWVADPSAGTRVYEGANQHQPGFLETFGKHLRTDPGHPHSPRTDFAGLPDHDWNEVVVTRLGTQLSVEVNDRLILQGSDPRVRTPGRVGLGFKRSVASHLYFRDIAFDWLDEAGEPLPHLPATIAWHTPANHSDVPAGQPIELRGTVESPGEIADLALFAGADFLGAPQFADGEWSLLWEAPVIGTYSLALRVTDSEDRVTWSEPRFLVVSTHGGAGGNAPPAVTIGQDPSIAAPAFGLAGSAVDPDGAVAVVRLFLEDTFIGHGRIAGNTWSYSLTNLPTGTYTFTAEAFDDRGGRAVTSFTTDVDGNAPPTISSIPNQTFAQGVATGPLAFTVSDDETPVDDLLLTVESSNPVLVPTESITLGGTGTQRTIEVSPVSGESGFAVITLTVTDAGGKSASTVFTVTVLAPPVPTTLTVSPASTGVAPTGSVAFSAVLRDQFGDPVDPQPTLAWAVSGGGTISPAGVFTAGNLTGGPHTVTVTGGGFTATALVSIAGAPPSKRTVVHWAGDYVAAHQCNPAKPEMGGWGVD